MSGTCPVCYAPTRGTLLRDADGPRVFRYCDICGFATVDPLLSRRSNGASEVRAPSPPAQATWRGDVKSVVAPFSWLIG